MKWTCKRHTYECTVRQRHSFRTQFLVFKSARISAKLQPEVVFRCGLFLISSSNISKTPFFRTLVYEGFYKGCFYKVSRDSFKNCILACKISNQMHTNFEKRKVPQAASDNFVQKLLFCKTYVSHNICFFIFGQNP